MICSLCLKNKSRWDTIAGETKPYCLSCLRDMGYVQNDESGEWHKEDEAGSFVPKNIFTVSSGKYAWSYDENENAIRIFRGDYQIAKIPKKETPYAEYYPNKQQLDWIISALNEYEKINPMWKDEQK